MIIARMKVIKTCRTFRLRFTQVAAMAVAVIVAVAALVEFARWMAGP